ncbi:MAG: hypothetical protein IJM84_04505 [Bacteroidaceae bacterium]|jgi:hypothetical protein|nr:hypothetical protein [Bacteroidaceae bacterium]
MDTTEVASEKMNLYLRFFNDEVLVETAQQAIDFLRSLPDLNVSDALCADLVHYAESKNRFPKRFKIGSKLYFIVIKTTAKTMEEFKAYVPTTTNEVAEDAEQMQEDELKTETRSVYETEQPGWYHVTMRFKRVIMDEESGKCSYVDTDFEVKLKAESIQDSYNRVVDHLRNRFDVDERSQFPSIRGRNFKAEFLGE